MSVTTRTAPAAFEKTARRPLGSTRSRGRHRRNLHERIVSGPLSHGGWSLVVATTAVSGFNFLFHVVVSRLLGPSQYGALNALLNIIPVLAVPLGAVQLAVTQAVVSGAGNKRISERVSLRGLTIRATLWGAGAAAALGVVSPLIDGFLNLKSPLADLAIGAWIPLAVAAAVLQGALLAELRFVPIAVATFFGGGALRLASGVLLVSAGFGPGGAVAATVIGQAFTTAALLLVARREVFATGLDPIRISLRDAVLSIAALAGYTMLTGIDVFLARHFLAPVAAGRYAAAATAGRIAMFVPGALAMVAFPRLVSAGRSGISVGKTLTEMLGLVTATGLAAFAVLAAMPGVIVGVLFGPNYLGAASIVGIVALTSVFLSVIGLLTYFHIARRSVAALYSWAGVALVWVLVAVLHGGMETIAVCMLAASGFVLVAVLLPAVAVVVRPVPQRTVLRHSTVELPPAEIDLSLIIPFYNPGPRLASHVRAVVGVLRAEQVTFEVIAVSDGSTDGSPSLIAGIDRVRIVEFAENQGKGAALRGLAQGRGRYLGFIDADGDIPAWVLSQFLAVIRAGDPDVVLGSKRHPDSDVVYPPLRRLYSFGYQQLIRLLFRLPTRDTQTGIKLIRRETLAAVLPKMLEKRFAFDLELLVVARRTGYRNFAELPVHIAERFTSTISLKAVRRTLLDTLAIFYRLRVTHFYGPQLALAASHSQVPRPAPASWPRADAPWLTARALAGYGPADGPLRILAYNWRDLAHPRAGGAEVYLQSVAHEWVKRGNEVTVFCGAVAGRPAEEFVNGARILRRGGRISVYREARRYWRREGDGQYDLVVDCVNTRPFLSPRFVRNVPIVAVIHQVAREVWRYETPWPISVLGRYLLEPGLATGIPGCTGCHRVRVEPRIARGIWPATNHGRAGRMGADLAGPSQEGVCPDRCFHRTAER